MRWLPVGVTSSRSFRRFLYGKNDPFGIIHFVTHLFFFVFIQEDIQLQEIYRSMVIVVLHLYAIIHDIYDSGRLCPSESLGHLQILRQ